MPIALDLVKGSLFLLGNPALFSNFVATGHKPKPSVAGAAFLGLSCKSYQFPDVVARWEKTNFFDLLHHL